jgi:hypothetical protein
MMFLLWKTNYQADITEKETKESPYQKQGLEKEN